MPRAAQACTDPNCPDLQPCAKHRKVAWQGSNRRRELPKGWDKLRAFVLIRDPICKVCGEASSEEVDHIGDRNDHRLSNLRGICSPCHASKSGKQGAKARNG